MESNALAQQTQPAAKKVLTNSSLNRFKEAKDRAGIVYISRIPPHMKPSTVRALLAPFGELGRIYLSPADKVFPSKKGKTRPDPKDGKFRISNFVDGWLEFKSKSSAETAAAALNGSIVGGKKSSRFHDDLWNIKFLPNFKWSQLTEKLAYERAVREQKLRNELSMAKRENSEYARQVERAQIGAKIEEKRAAKRAKHSTEHATMEASSQPSKKPSADLEAIKRRFRQRKPVNA